MVIVIYWTKEVMKEWYMDSNLSIFLIIESVKIQKVVGQNRVHRLCWPVCIMTILKRTPVKL